MRFNALGRRWSQSIRSLQTASAASSVNADEIAHFSRLSSLWWDEHGEFALLHRMNPTRVQYIREKLIEVTREEKGEQVGDSMAQRRAVLQGLDVLDVGCGGGLLSEVRSSCGLSNAPTELTHLTEPGKDGCAHAGRRRLRLEYRHRVRPCARRPTTDLARVPQRVCRGALGGAKTVRRGVRDGGPRTRRQPCWLLVDVRRTGQGVYPWTGVVCPFLTRSRLQPGGHLFLSTIARTPLAYLLTIVAAEHVLRKVAVGTHTYSKFINPLELVSFFSTYSSPSSIPEVSGKRWISRTYDHGLPTRTEAEVRGIIYLPWSGNWQLMSRGATQWGAAECNYLFWVRKPRES